MANILGIGNATLDIVHTVDGYPDENAEVRCLDRTVCRGGNTANTLVVLSQLGHACSWAGVLVDNADGDFIRADLAAQGVDFGPSRVLETGSVPVSSILVNIRSGSRTIIHYRDLPEFTAGEFQRIDLQGIDWLHFEGRNVSELQSMLQWARAQAPAIPRSLEVEKPRPGIEAVFRLADVLLFSRDYARHHGYRSADRLLQAIRGDCPQADLFCTWGEEGATALDRQGRCYRQAAILPGRVIDTLGAGDTFNAAVINGCLAGLDTAELLRQGCALAGRKCTRHGFTGLAGNGSPGA